MRPANATFKRSKDDASLPDRLGPVVAHDHFSVGRMMRAYRTAYPHAVKQTV